MSDRPNEKRNGWLSRVQARDKWLPLGMLGAAAGAYIAREGSLFRYSHGWLDNILFVVLCAVVVWLLWPNKRDEAEH